jgi:hypothetical protein
MRPYQKKLTKAKKERRKEGRKEGRKERNQASKLGVCVW